MSLKEEDYYSREIEKSLKLYIGEYGGLCSDNNSSYDETEEDIARRAIFKEGYNQNNKKNEKNENLNCSKLPEMKLDEEKDNRKKESALVNSVNLFVNEPQSEDKSDVRDYPKIKIKAKTIKCKQVIEDEKNEQKQTTQLINKKRKPENKNEMNTENKNDNTNKTNLIQNLDETNLNIGLDGNNSDGLNYENIGIQGNKEKHENIHLIYNIENKNTAIGSNIESITSNNNEKEIIERAIRVDHMINIIKNTIMKNFISEFNKVNESYKLRMEEAKNEDSKKNVGHKKRVKKKEEKEGEDIIIYIKIKHNDSIENDQNFMTTNFHDVIEKAKEMQNYGNLVESKEANTLINKIKKDYLKELLDKNENLFQPNLIDQTNRCINKKCNDVANQIFKTSNLDGLIIIFKYGKARGNSINFREKNLFANEIKNLKGYEKFTLELNKIDEDFLQFYMDELKKIAQNPLDYLVYLKNTKKKGMKK